MLKRTMTLGPVEPPNYHFTDAEDNASAKVDDKAKAEVEDKAKAEAGQDALRAIFQRIRHLPAVLPREDARQALHKAEADFAMANEEVLRAHKMNGPNVEYHVQSAVTYREDSRRRLAAAQEYAAQEDSTRDCFETYGGGEGPPPTD